MVWDPRRLWVCVRGSQDPQGAQWHQIEQTRAAATGRLWLRTDTGWLPNVRHGGPMRIRLADGSWPFAVMFAPQITWTNTADGGAAGTDVTVANSGGASGRAFTSVVVEGGGSVIQYVAGWGAGPLSYQLLPHGRCLLQWGLHQQTGTYPQPGSWTETLYTAMAVQLPAVGAGDPGTRQGLTGMVYGLTEPEQGVLGRVLDIWIDHRGRLAVGDGNVLGYNLSTLRLRPGVWASVEVGYSDLRYYDGYWVGGVLVAHRWQVDVQVRLHVDDGSETLLVPGHIVILSADPDSTDVGIQGAFFGESGGDLYAPGTRLYGHPVVLDDLWLSTTGWYSAVAPLVAAWRLGVDVLAAHRGLWPLYRNTQYGEDGLPVVTEYVDLTAGVGQWAAHSERIWYEQPTYWNGQNIERTSWWVLDLDFYRQSMLSTLAADGYGIEDIVGAYLYLELTADTTGGGTGYLWASTLIPTTASEDGYRLLAGPDTYPSTPMQGLVLASVDLAEPWQSVRIDLDAQTARSAPYLVFRLTVDEIPYQVTRVDKPAVPPPSEPEAENLLYVNSAQLHFQRDPAG